MRPAALALAALLLAGCAGWRPDDGDREVLALLEVADRMTRSGDYRRAVATYDRVLAREPGEPMASRAQASRAAAAAVAAAQAEVAAARAEAEAARAEAQAVRADLARLRQALTGREGDVGRLRQELAAREAELQRMSAEVEQLRKDLEQLKQIDLRLERKR